jgi:hypothetical protein
MLLGPPGLTRPVPSCPRSSASAGARHGLRMRGTDFEGRMDRAKISSSTVRVPLTARVGLDLRAVEFACTSPGRIVGRHDRAGLRRPARSRVIPAARSGGAYDDASGLPTRAELVPGFLVLLPGGRPRPRLAGAGGAAGSGAGSGWRRHGGSLARPKSWTRRTEPAACAGLRASGRAITRAMRGSPGTAPPCACAGQLLT